MVHPCRKVIEELGSRYFSQPLRLLFIPVRIAVKEAALRNQGKLSLLRTIMAMAWEAKFHRW